MKDEQLLQGIEMLKEKVEELAQSMNVEITDIAWEKRINTLILKVFRGEEERNFSFKIEDLAHLPTDKAGGLKSIAYAVVRQLRND